MREHLEKYGPSPHGEEPGTNAVIAGGNSATRARATGTTPTSQQRAQMAAFIDAKQPGLLDDLGIQRQLPPM
jgi:hypothetical protein